MNKIKQTIGSILAIIFGAYLLITYVFGMYTLIASDKYSSKQMIGGGWFPPYAIYVGSKELYRLTRDNTAENTYDLYPYTAVEILGVEQTEMLREIQGYTQEQIEKRAYKVLVMTLNKIEDKELTETFLKRFHNHEVTFYELSEIADNS